MTLMEQDRDSLFVCSRDPALARGSSEARFHG
jgi:hypothetical protein